MILVMVIIKCIIVVKCIMVIIFIKECIRALKSHFIVLFINLNIGVLIIA